MKKFIWLHLVGLLLFTSTGLAANINTMHQCASITNTNKRLDCYDNAAAQLKKGANKTASSSKLSPTDKKMLASLREAWGKQITSVQTSSGIMQVHTTFASINQIAYEVMLATMCGVIAKNKKEYAGINTIGILNQAQNQGYAFTDPEQCDQIAFKPVNQTRLIILGNTNKLKSK